MELDKSNAAIAKTFNSIAEKYDFLNHLLSFNIDKIWRRKTVRSLMTALGKSNPKILDLACGTGDLSGVMYKRGAVVTGADISEGMLSIAREKNARLEKWAMCHVSEQERGAMVLPEYKVDSAEHLSFNMNSFDAVTIAFGFRNFENRKSALEEISRVLVPDGKLYILEFAYPSNFFAKAMFNVYFKYYLPFVGKIVSKDKDAYKYLVDSVIAFPKYDALCAEIESAGFGNVKYRRFTFGIACLYTADNTKI